MILTTWYSFQLYLPYIPIQSIYLYKLQYGMIFNFMHVCVTPGTSKHENFVFQEVPFLGNFGIFFGFFMSLQLLTDDE